MTNFYLTMIDILVIAGFVLILSLVIALFLFIWWVSVHWLMRFKHIRNGLFLVWLKNELIELSDDDYRELQEQMHKVREYKKRSER